MANESDNKRGLLHRFGAFCGFYCTDLVRNHVKGTFIVHIKRLITYLIIAYFE